DAIKARSKRPSVHRRKQPIATRRLQMATKTQVAAARGNIGSEKARTGMVDIIHRIGIKAPVAKVIEAVSTVAGVAGWWTKDTTGTSGPEGSMTVRFSDPAGKEIGRMDF